MRRSSRPSGRRCRRSPPASTSTPDRPGRCPPRRRRRWPRWRPGSATSGAATSDTFEETLVRMAEARAAVAAVARHRRRGGRADPLDDRRHERRGPRRSTGARAAGSSRPRPSTPADWGRCTRCGIGPGSRSSSSMPAAMATTIEPWRPSTRRSRRDAARLVVARALDDRRGHADRRHRRPRPRPGRGRHRRRRAGRRRDPVPVRRARRRCLRRSRPRSGCSGRRAWAPWWSRRRSSSGLSPALGGWFSFERCGRRRPRRWWADARRFEIVQLPPPGDRRDGPLDRLAVDVRRARLRLPARDGDGPRRRPTGWRASTG